MKRMLLGASIAVLFLNRDDSGDVSLYKIPNIKPQQIPHIRKISCKYQQLDKQNVERRYDRCR